MGLLSLKRLIGGPGPGDGDGDGGKSKPVGSPCQQEDDNQDAKRMRNPRVSLPEDIWYHIHSLLPLRDAARAACVSSTFLCSWRCRPNLIFSQKTLGLNGNWRENVRELINKVDHIMKNHSGIGLRTFGLQSYNLINTCYLDRWLNIAITPAIEELSLTQFPENNTKYYNFPCSILFNRGGNSIKHICLSYCAFRPTGGLNFLRRLHLGEVHITGDELECLLSNSFALEQLTLKYCKELNYLRIPCQLQQLKDLEVYERKALQMMEVKAPNLSTFHYDGNLARLSDGGLLAVKKLRISSFYQYNNVHYASANLSSIVPTIETLIISSFGEVSQIRMEHDVISENSSHLRQMPRSTHGNIKNVNIIGFCSAKSMIDLTCHILENATSLECLTLDTIHDDYVHPDRLSLHEVGFCYRIGSPMIMEAENALLAIKRYIVGKVPSTVKLVVLKPCSWCHATEGLGVKDHRVA
uniref:At1g61320/AtMIF1 LRR domain-containing protein n=1 Tax=Oryza glumipatula TaxID=40148 RepID=A0A0E0A1Z2_9ORYZ